MSPEAVREDKTKGKKLEWGNPTHLDKSQGLDKEDSVEVADTNADV